MKKGKSNTLLWIVAIVAVLFVAGVIKYNNGGITFSTAAAPGGGAPNVPATGCAVNPSLVDGVVDAQAPGTSLSGSTNYYRLVAAAPGVTVPQYLGTTSPTVAGTYDILITNTSYLSKIHPGQTLNCGSNVLSDSLNAFGAPSIAVYNSAYSALTNTSTGGNVNETSAGAGGSYIETLRLTGQALKSTGPMTIVVESAAPAANVSSMSLGGVVGVAGAPRGHSTTVAGSAVYTFRNVQAINGAGRVDLPLSIQSVAAKKVEGAVYISIYSMQPFVDADGTFNPGTEAYDSLGTLKAAQAAQVQDFFIKPA